MTAMVVFLFAFCGRNQQGDGGGQGSSAAEEKRQLEREIQVTHQTVFSPLQSRGNSILSTQRYEGMSTLRAHFLGLRLRVMKVSGRLAGKTPVLPTVHALADALHGSSRVCLTSPSSSDSLRKIDSSEKNPPREEISPGLLGKCRKYEFASPPNCKPRSAILGASFLATSPTLF